MFPNDDLYNNFHFWLFSHTQKLVVFYSVQCFTPTPNMAVISEVVGDARNKQASGMILGHLWNSDNFGMTYFLPLI